LKELNLTLYEFFGYLLPGAIAAVAMLILFYLTALSGNQVYIPDVTKTVVGIALVVAYYSGHIVQAIGNIAYKKVYHPEQEVLCVSKGPLPANLIVAVKIRLMAIYSLDDNDLVPALIYRLCDEYVVQNGNVGDRDIFQYREGFYRGLSISCMLTSVVSFMMLLARPIKIVWFTYCEAIVTKGMFAFLAITSLIGAALFYNRYKRFCTYKVVQAVTSFIVICNKKQTA